MSLEDEIIKLKKNLENHEQRILNLEEFLKKTPEKMVKKLSIKEFILSKKPEGDVQTTLIICYYLENYDKLSSFNIKDIEDGFRGAKLRVPKNINSKIIKNIGKGHVMEGTEKKDNLKAWTLTASGEQFVENNFQ